MSGQQQGAPPTLEKPLNPVDDIRCLDPEPPLFFEFLVDAKILLQVSTAFRNVYFHSLA